MWTVTRDAGEFLQVSATADSVEVWSGKDRGDENFPVGSRLIASRLRAHVHAFYDFARNADDIGDSTTLDAHEKVARLDAMEDVLLGRRTSGAPSASRLRESLAQTGVTAAHACDLLVAFRRDAMKRRYADWAELLDYCRYSAMPVGRHVLDLHGEARDTYPASDALCASLQVLNHLQDCARDLAELDRCYLPLDLMAEHGASVEDLRGTRETVGLRRVFSALLERCDALNMTGSGLPRRTRDRRLRLEVAVICGLARSLRRRLAAADPIAGRVKLTTADAIGSALRAVRFLP